MPRIADIAIALVALLLLAVPMTIVALAVKLTSQGPVLHWSERVGRHGRRLAMPKFRSMRIDTPAIATHLLTDSRVWLTPVGGFLRRSSLDELPQFWCVLIGQMSVVGPRPALFNQHDLIEARRHHGVDRLRPGLTGWAQVNGRDNLSINDKVTLDTEYARRRSFAIDAKIIWMTIVRVVTARGVSH